MKIAKKAFNLELKAFRDVLYEDESDHKISISSLRLDKDRIMSRYSQIKIGLTDLYYKQHVAADKITCTPMKLNGKFL